MNTVPPGRMSSVFHDPSKIRLFGGRGGPRPPFTPKIAIFGVVHSGHPHMTHSQHSLVECRGVWRCDPRVWTQGCPSIAALWLAACSSGNSDSELICIAHHGPTPVAGIRVQTIYIVSGMYPLTRVKVMDTSC